MRLSLGFPVEKVLDEVASALESRGCGVLCAAPGAGKTTLIPPFLLDAPFMNGKRMIVLEPRRLAARAAACRVASLLGESVGGLVGYRTRLDSKVSSRTRIEFVTEGILTRMIQDEQSLEGVGLLVFDEFHERSVHADLGLALALDVRSALRDDLRILVMSATLDAGRVAALLDDAPVVACEGRLFDIKTVYIDRRREKRLEDDVVRAVCRALAMGEGDILVFLPGEGEIRRVGSLLSGESLPGAVVLPLYGNLPVSEQDRALTPDPNGRRKIILSTSIAETSLTVEGVRTVVDSGMMRVPKFCPRTGMGRLETVRVSLASADQRRGRSGRTAPGTCLRLWGEDEHRSLAAFNVPEILEADMAPLALELAKWGVGEASLGTLKWLDHPPQAKFHVASELLKGLGAIDASGRISKHGEELLRLPLHPRLAHMVSSAKKLGVGALACELAALLSERDSMRGANSDLRERLCASASRGSSPDSWSGLSVDGAAIRRVRETVAQLRRSAGVSGESSPKDVERAGLVLGFAYPDRIAKARSPNSGDYVLSNGMGARLRRGDPLSASEFIVAGQSEGDTVYLAAPVELRDIEEHFPHLLSEETLVSWDSSAKAVAAEKVERLGSLALSRKSVAGKIPKDRLLSAFLEGLRKEGASAIPWSEAALGLRARVNFLRKFLGEDWPDMSDEGLLASLEDWLAPYVEGCLRLEHLKRVDLHAALEGLLDHKMRQSLGKLAPERVEVPSGSKIRVEYDAPDSPAVSVKLQELFGLLETPLLAGGRTPVTFRILSPSMRPVQITKDLASFWRESYFLVRKDLRGRYPKHDWPEDPLNAAPHRGVRRPR